MLKGLRNGWFLEAGVDCTLGVAREMRDLIRSVGGEMWRGEECKIGGCQW